MENPPPFENPRSAPVIFAAGMPMKVNIFIIKNEWDSVKSKQFSSTNQINILNQIQVRDAGTGVLENLSSLIF